MPRKPTGRKRTILTPLRWAPEELSVARAKAGARGMKFEPYMRDLARRDRVPRDPVVTALTKT